MTRNVKTTRLEVSRAYFRGGQIGGQQIDRVKKPIALTPDGWGFSFMLFFERL